MINNHKLHTGEDTGPKECHIGLAEGKTYFDYEQSVQDKNGNLKFSQHVWVSVAPGCENSLSKVYVCLVDITERKKAEKQLEKRSLFSRAIVHELKTPLTPMLVASEILASTQDEKSKPIAQNLYDGAVALNKRIDELMDISRGEIGTLQVKLEKCDVISVIRNTVDELLCLFQNREQTLTLTADTSGLMINIDPERIRQILVNLLDNASKFTPRG
jgi:signal transduction histidine kinase